MSSIRIWHFQAKQATGKQSLSSPWRLVQVRRRSAPAAGAGGRGWMVKATSHLTAPWFAQRRTDTSPSSSSLFSRPQPAFYFCRHTLDSPFHGFLLEKASLPQFSIFSLCLRKPFGSICSHILSQPPPLFVPKYKADAI